jgi:hypothetical protein
MLQAIRKVLSRDLATLERELGLYGDDAGPWVEVPGLANGGGTLALHLVGNLQHFIGAQLGGSGFQRDRDAEFTRRGVPRAELQDAVRATAEVVEATLAGLDPARLAELYPLAVMGATVGTEVFLVHLCSHLAYHLGQVDAHRRVVSGQGAGAGAQAVSALLG